MYLFNSAKSKISKQKIAKLEQTKKVFNFEIGLAILRPILSFIVVESHCHNKSYLQGIWKFLFVSTEKTFFTIRIFMIMSFYFTYNTFLSKDYKKLFKRLERIFIPYFLWPILFFFFNKYLKILFKINVIININTLKNQFNGGCGFIFPLYFQLCLAILTIVHLLVIFLFKKFYNFALIIIILIVFNIQYNGKNLFYFKKYKIFVGRTVEFLPCTAIGFIIASTGIMNFFKQYRFNTIVVCIYLCYLLIFYNIFESIKGFEVCGFKMFIVSICLFIIFALFPSEKIKNKIIIKIIKQIANYTAGIYYIHVPIHNYCKFYIKSIAQQTIKGCMINYLICYFICLIGNAIFRRTLLRHLFV